VDLPAPWGPSSGKIVPGATAKLTPLTASTSPPLPRYVLRRSTTSTACWSLARSAAATDVALIVWLIWSPSPGVGRPPVDHCSAYQTLFEKSRDVTVSPHGGGSDGRDDGNTRERRSRTDADAGSGTAVVAAEAPG